MYGTNFTHKKQQILSSADPSTNKQYNMFTLCSSCKVFTSSNQHPSGSTIVWIEKKRILFHIPHVFFLFYYLLPVLLIHPFPPAEVYFLGMRREGRECSLLINHLKLFAARLFCLYFDIVRLIHFFFLLFCFSLQLKSETCIVG
jgi:hypothetical protein